ncbi:uncharacterized protein OCT59_025831 [Rhizophagus irregularis]|uniref:uncharacterized protein n=1 Tax=Rhizophagus irregularis TaxID=588596 RepID=UPI00331E3465|nr:hypothetical protein OCT59_025831 [Rhizophagus irregularis]
MWEDGPLLYDSNKYIRKSKKVVLKYLNNLTYFDELLNNNKIKIYGISQITYTKNYVIVIDNEDFEIYFQKYCIKCNEIYTYIQHEWCKPCELNYLKYNLTKFVFEWIPYEQFNDIKEKDDLIYSAIWKNGPLYWNEVEYTRNLDKEVVLKHVYNSQNTINEFLDQSISIF